MAAKKAKGRKKGKPARVEEPNPPAQREEADAKPACTSCGTRNDPDAVFCKKCGARQRDDEEEEKDESPAVQAEREKTS